MLGPEGPTGKRVLDLFAGSGAFGLEALSRGADRADFVEIDERRCRDIRRSLAELDMKERGFVHRGDAAVVAGRLEGPFDIVFIDPPYAEDPFEKTFAALDEKRTLADDCVAFAEHAARLDLPERLPGVRLVRRRTYGDTAVSVYRCEPGVAQGQ